MEPGHWVFLHILLLVFWLGTDLSFPQRAVLLQYAMIIDILPRDWPPRARPSRLRR